jgi:hypothetical protein
MKNKVILLVFLLCLSQLNSQNRVNTSNHNAWYMFFGQYKFKQNWSIGFESQWRRNDYGSLPQQLLLRTGLNYELNQNITITTGYCYVKTYPYGEFPVEIAFPENRIWEQIQLKHQIGKLEQINRIRLEQRFSKLPQLNSDSNYTVGQSIYANRLRILNRFTIPFKGKEIVDKSFYLSIYNEVMFSFGKHVGTNFLDQNRAYIAIGYKIPSVGRLEIGFLEQTLFKNANINALGKFEQKVENNHTLQLGLTINIDHSKKIDK